MKTKLNKLRFSDYFGRNYDEFVTLRKHVSVMKTGKSAKKSSQIARMIVLRAVMDQRFCAIVLRKVNLDHEKSTFPAIVKAFNKLQKLTGYDWRRYWEVNKGAKNPHIINTATGQIMRFVSFDKPESLAGLEMEDDRLQYGIIWFEEPMQIADKNNSGIIDSQKQKQEKENFEIIKSSAFRGEMLPKFWREIIFSFNDWSDGDYWIINEYVKPYIRENESLLDKKGKQLHYDPNYENGKGIMVLVGSGGLNEYNDKDYIYFIKRIKQDDPEFFKAIWLGTSAAVSGNAYALANINKIRRDIDLSLVKEWLIGVDYSSRKDFTAVYLIGFNNETYDVQIVDGWDYHRGKAANPMPEPELIQTIWEKICEWRITYNFSNLSTMAEVHVDSRDATVRSYLQQHWENSKAERMDIMSPSPAAKWNSAASYIRILVTRYMMGSGKLRVAPHLKGIMDEFKARTITKDRGIQDGGDDRCQSFEYSWSHQIEDMIPRIAYDAIYESYMRVRWEQKQEGSQ